MVSDYRLEYTSPRGDKVVFDPNAIDGPYLLMPTPRGMASNSSDVKGRKSVQQTGETATDLEVSSKSVSAEVIVLGNTPEEYWQRRKDLTRALAMEPMTTLQEKPAPGTLRLMRPGLPDLEMQVFPEDSPQEAGRPDRMSAGMDMEFRAMRPFWRDIGLSQAVMEQDGAGFTMPNEFPMEMAANDVQQTISNEGDLSTPITVKMFGEFTNGRLINLTTGDYLEYLGTVAQGEHVEVTTEFGEKTATLVAGDGSRTNAMGSMNLTDSVFWMLAPGDQEVLFEADTNISAYATMTYRQRYGGA